MSIEMREIVNGVLYDTDDATEIGSWTNAEPAGDFRRIEETLYRTESGQYFIAGSGGALTRYSRPVPTGGSAGGREIRPISESEALAWAEGRLETDTVLEEFDVEAA